MIRVGARMRERQLVLPGAVLVLQAEEQISRDGLYVPHLLGRPVLSQLSAGTSTGLDVQQRYSPAQ